MYLTLNIAVTSNIDVTSDSNMGTILIKFNKYLNFDSMHSIKNAIIELVKKNLYKNPTFVK